MAGILTREGDVLHVTLSGARGFEFHHALDQIKEIPGRRWNPETKVWVLPGEPDVAQRVIQTIKPAVDDDVMAWIRDSRHEAEESLTTPLPDDAKLLVPWANERAPWQPEVVNDEKIVGLLPYQRAAVAHLLEKRRALLCDDMGLGKTVQAISTISEYEFRNYLRALWGEETLNRVLQGLAKGERPSIGVQTVSYREAASSLRREHGLAKDSQGSTVCGLWGTPSARVHGVGSRAWSETLRLRYGGGVEEASARGSSEVRGAVSELPSPEALSRKPVLVVCPNSVKGSWRRELKRWLGDDVSVVVLEGSAVKRRQQLQDGIASGSWIITNWESLRVQKVQKTIKRKNGSTSKRSVLEMKEPLFEHTEWLAVVADEVHRAKNRKALQTQGLWRCRGDIMLGLSGTPIQNSPDEAWAILRWLYPEQYHESGKHGTTAYWRFYNMYCDFYEGSFGKVITGVKNPDGLRFELSGRLVRRTADILGLKGRKRIYYDVDLNNTQQTLYNKAEDDLLIEIIQAAKEGDASAARFAKAVADGADTSTLLKIPNGASRLLRLQQIIETPATLGAEDDSALMDDAVQKVMDSRPSQWVIGTKFKISTNLLADRLKREGLEVGVYTGDTPPADRTAMEDKFQAGEVDVIVGTLAALKEGITLTAAHLMYCMTRSFVPAENDQFEGRCDRLGQQELVRVYIPQAVNTVSPTKVEPMLNLKERIIGTVLPKIKIEMEIQ